jgi:hypothetical protein
VPPPPKGRPRGGSITRKENAGNLPSEGGGIADGGTPFPNRYNNSKYERNFIFRKYESGGIFYVLGIRQWRKELKFYKQNEYYNRRGAYWPNLVRN